MKGPYKALFYQGPTKIFMAGVTLCAIYKGCTKQNLIKLAPQFSLNFSYYKHARSLEHILFEK